MPSLVVIGQHIKEKRRGHNILTKYPCLDRVDGVGTYVFRDSN